MPTIGQDITGSTKSQTGASCVIEFKAREQILVTSGDKCNDRAIIITLKNY